jgi:hypothetical protein
MNALNDFWQINPSEKCASIKIMIPFCMRSQNDENGLFSGIIDTYLLDYTALHHSELPHLGAFLV